MIQKSLALNAKQLKKRISLAQMKFEATDELQGSADFLGQPRAKSALEFGLNVPGNGYNLYVMGENGTGRQSLVSHYVRQQASSRPAANDWLYFHNFDQPREPIALELPAGQAEVLKKDMQLFINELLDTFPAAFENPSYQRKRSSIEKTFNKKYEKALQSVERAGSQQQIAVISEGNNLMFAVQIDGQVLDESEFAQLPEEVRDQFQERIESLEDLLTEALLELPSWKRESNEQMRQLNTQTINNALRPLIRDLEHQWDSQLGVLKILRQYKQHLPMLLVELLSDEVLTDPKPDHERRQQFNALLLPNILVSNQTDQGLPVIYELMPTWQNLFGRIEYALQQGTPSTNFQLIRAGALHRANGGYLILDAEKLLMEPFSWESLKLALQTKSINLESPFSESSAFNPISLNPQTIQLRVRIILVGSREVYYQLLDLDPEFNELFRVLVDFDNSIKRSKDSIELLVRRIKHYVEQKKYLPVARQGVETLIEHALRQAEHQDKMTARIINIFKIIGEAHYLASLEASNRIERAHIKQALANSQHRTGRISEQMLEEIHEGTVLIDTQGKAMGRVNGLTVIEIGESLFGSPARITATAYAGAKGIVDIEREAELGQSIHTKGVMILNGYLGHVYGRDFPLMFSASIAMEQSYGHVDGDSATVAETCALISAIAEVPVDQALAITGSMNQHGDVQAIGGVNEKIEGYYRVCLARGLTGSQGVIIPKDNIKHLMLNDEVVRAVATGRFHIWAISHIEQALELLMGIPVGKIDDKGQYPDGSLNQRMMQKLRYLHDQSMEAGEEQEGEGA